MEHTPTTSASTSLKRRTLTHLCGRILRTTGQPCICAARTLANDVDLDMVAMLVGAADRHQAAISASRNANDGLHHVIQRVQASCPPTDDRIERIESVVNATMTYIYSLNEPERDDAPARREHMTSAINGLTGLMVRDGSAHVDVLVFRAVSAAMAELAEMRALQSFREIQAAILAAWDGAPLVLPNVAD